MDLQMIEPEPRAKRTVEGDLGVYVNARNIVELAGDPAWEARLPDLQALPKTEQQIELTRWLCTARWRLPSGATPASSPTSTRRPAKSRSSKAKT